MTSNVHTLQLTHCCAARPTLPCAEAALVVVETAAGLEGVVPVKKWFEHKIKANHHNSFVD